MYVVQLQARAHGLHACHGEHGVSRTQRVGVAYALQCGSKCDWSLRVTTYISRTYHSLAYPRLHLGTLVRLCKVSIERQVRRISRLLRHPKILDKNQEKGQLKKSKGSISSYLTYSHVSLKALVLKPQQRTPSDQNPSPFPFLAIVVACSHNHHQRNTLLARNI